MKKILLVLALLPCFGQFSHAETNKIAPKKLYISLVSASCGNKTVSQKIDLQPIEPAKNNPIQKRQVQQGELIIWKMLVSFFSKFAFTNVLAFVAVWLFFTGIKQVFWPLWVLGLFLQMLAWFGFVLLIPAVEKQELRGGVVDYVLGACMWKAGLLFFQLFVLGLIWRVPWMQIWLGILLLFWLILLLTRI